MQESVQEERRLSWWDFKRFCQDNQQLGAYICLTNYHKWKASGGTEVLTIEDARRGGRGGRGGSRGYGAGGYGAGGSWR